ncbi:alcohol dehydrogenase catalytic domain-containing protein [Microbacterium kribbense]
MLAVHTTAKRTLSFDDVPPPRLSPGRALVRVHAVSLCGTDLHIFEDRYPTTLPLVQGHELTGTVIEADPADRVRAGDRVAIDPLVACGACAACRGGHANVCQNLSVLGCYQDGGLTEVLSVGVDRLHAVPDDLPLDLAALGEPTSIAMQAVSRAEPTPGDVVLVLGCGPIGLLATLSLSERGVTVVAADIDPQRAALAPVFGAAHALSVDRDFPDGAGGLLLDGLTEGAGPRLIIEATGVPASLQNAIRLIAPAGRIVQVGISAGHAEIRIKDLTDKEIELRGSRNSRGLIPEALALLGRHREAAQRLVTHRFPLTRLAEAFDTMADPGVLTEKIIIDVERSGR